MNSEENSEPESAGDTQEGKRRGSAFTRDNAREMAQRSAEARRQRRADADANPLGVSRADLVAIARKLAQAAKAGDTGAARLVLQYVAILNPAATKEEGSGDKALDVDAMTAEQRIALRQRIAQELAGE